MQEFLWLANWPALDFVNTEIIRDQKRIDLFETGADVAAWLRTAGLANVPAVLRSAELLAAAHKYRKYLRRGLESLVSSGRIDAETIAATNRLLDRGRFSVRLQRDGKKKFRLERCWNLGSAADQVIPVAGSFADLLATGDLRRVCRCKNPECILFFYDTSKSATRTWCSLDICGNKLRVAAFRKRHSNGVFETTGSMSIGS